MLTQFLPVWRVKCDPWREHAPWSDACSCRPRAGTQGHRNIVKRKGHILVVEPDDLIREILERWLREAGYTVTVQALQKLPKARMRGEAPHLIVVDVPNPRTAAKLIQSLQEVYPTPILLLSARFRRGLGASVDVARQLGVRKILPKPFTSDELLSAVSESIDVP